MLRILTRHVRTSTRFGVIRSSFKFSTNNQPQAQRKFKFGSWVLMGAGLALGSLLWKQLTGDDHKPSSPLGFRNWSSLTLSEITPVSHNSSMFAFDLETPTTKLALPIHSFVLARPHGQGDIRAYTPIDTDRPGKLVLLVKRMENGNVSKHIHSLKVGDKLDFRGPVTKFTYLPNMKKEIGMVAGGSGLTPILQVLDTILKNPEDKTKVTLIYANVTEKDILLKDRLDRYAKDFADRLRLVYLVDKADSVSPGIQKGRISEQLLKATMPPPGSDSMIMVCGPPGMMNSVAGAKWGPYDMFQGSLGGALKNLGYNSDQVFKC